MPHSFFSFSRTDFFSGVLVVIWAAEGVLSTFSVFPWFLGLVSLLLLHTQLSLFGSHSANLKTMMVLADVVLSTLVLQLQQTSLAAQVHFCIRNRVLMVGLFFFFFWLSNGIRVLELKALMIGYVFDF